MNTKKQRVMQKKSKKYDFILPIGQACYTAYALRKINYRFTSGPFDWVYGAGLESRLKLFLSRFEHFFEKEDLEFVETKEENDVYQNNQTGLIFNHDFPKNCNFDQDYIDVFSKYTKRIGKTLKFIDKSKKILLLYIEIPNHALAVDEKKLLELVKKANEMYKGKNIDLLYIRHDQNMEKGRVEYQDLSQNVTIATCYNLDDDPKTPEWVANYEATYKVLDYVKLTHPIINALKWKIKKFKKELFKNKK